MFLGAGPFHLLAALRQFLLSDVLRNRALKPALNHGAVTFTVLMALLLSTMFMSITGGTLTPYERRTLATAFAGVVLGNAEARERLAADEAAPYVPRRSVHLVPIQPIVLPGPPVDADVALLGADLLGAPPARALPRAPRILPVTQLYADVIAESAPGLTPVAEPERDNVGGGAGN